MSHKVTYSVDKLTVGEIIHNGDANIAGTPAPGVTAATKGDGTHMVTTLTFALTDAFTVADNAALADGALLFTFPAGVIQVTGSHMNAAVVAAEDTTSTADLGLGTTVGSGAVATLDGTAAFENIMTGQTLNDCNGTHEIASVATNLTILAAADHTVYLNIADTWANTAGTDLTADAHGTVVLCWTKLT